MNDSVAKANTNAIDLVRQLRHELNDGFTNPEMNQGQGNDLLCAVDKIATDRQSGLCGFDFHRSR